MLRHFNSESYTKPGRDNSCQPELCGNAREVISLDGDKMKLRRSVKPRAGGNGFGISLEQVGYTLNTVDRHMVGIIRRR